MMTGLGTQQPPLKFAVYSQAVQPTGLAEHRQIVTLAEVREIHHATMAPVWEVSPHPNAMPSEAPGSYRRHDIHPFPGSMTPVGWPLVEAEMTEWVRRANSLTPSAPTFPEDLATVHCRFEQIHPFFDGNHSDINNAKRDPGALSGYTHFLTATAARDAWC